MDISHIDRKLNLDAEPRSLSEVMVRGELNWVAMLGFARARSRGSNMAGLDPVIRMRSFKANGVERETH